MNGSGAADGLGLESVVPPILEAAGQLALRWFRTDLVADDKGAGRGGEYDPVTEADRAIEDLIRGRLGERYPDHQIVGEERGVSGPAGRYRWLIDPIDGTRAFVSGSPLWGIMVGLLDGDEPVAGWVHQPYLDETFAAVGGSAALAHAGARRPLTTRRGIGLDAAVMYTTTPAMFAAGAELDAFRRVADAVRLVRYGGDCYAYCLLAMGQVDLVVEAGLQSYDIVPLIAIVEAAGGVVTGPDGERNVGGGFTVASANPTLHRQALAVIGARPGGPGPVTADPVEGHRGRASDEAPAEERPARPAWPGNAMIVRVGPGDADLVERAADLFDFPPRRDWIDAFLTAPGHHLLLALDGGAPLGFVSGVEMTHPDKGAEMLVYELATAVDHRRRGVATALLDALAAVAAERGCYGLWVSTEPDNAAALATYRSAGFTGEESITLERRLDPGGPVDPPDRQPGG